MYCECKERFVFRKRDDCYERNVKHFRLVQTVIFLIHRLSLGGQFGFVR